MVAAAVIFALLASAETSLPHVVDLFDDLNGHGRVVRLKVTGVKLFAIGHVSTRVPTRRCWR